MKLDGLESQLIGEIRQNELLKYHTGIRLGGPAAVLTIPKGIEDLRRTLVWAGKNQVPFRVIGNGSSVLPRPEGYEGMVIKLAHVLNHIRVEDNLVYVGAGAMMTTLVRQLLSHSLTGLEKWYGPHTVGGWLWRMGRQDAVMLDHLVKEMYVVLPDGSITRMFEPSQLFEDVSLTELPKTVVEVVFQLSPGDSAAIAEIIRQREQEWGFLTQLNLPLAGPVFLNTEEEALASIGALSGLKTGQAAFLGVGSGFVANLGDATYDDVVSLLSKVREKVQRITAITLLDGINQMETKEVIQW